MTTVTNVYVIGEGERGEGSTPVAVVRTLEAARQYVFDNYNGTFLHQGESRTHWVAPRLTGYDIDLVHVHRMRLRPV